MASDYTAGDVRKMARDLRSLPSRTRRKIFDRAADMLESLIEEKHVDETAYYAGLCDQLRDSLDEANKAIKELKERLEDDGR